VSDRYRYLKMEGNGTRMDYEDMFREITKKLYGEDPDHKSKFFCRSFFLQNKLKVNIVLPII